MQRSSQMIWLHWLPANNSTESLLKNIWSPHCPKFLKLSWDMLQSVDATKLNGAKLLRLFSRITFWTVLLFFVNELHNILRNSLWFCSVIWKYVTAWEPMTSYSETPRSTHLATATYEIEIFSSNASTHTQVTSYGWLTIVYSPQYTTGVLEHSSMLNQHSLCSDTEKWCLCNNTKKFVSIHKHYFSQIVAWQDYNL